MVFATQILEAILSQDANLVTVWTVILSVSCGLLVMRLSCPGFVSVSPSTLTETTNCANPNHNSQVTSSTTIATDV